MSSPQIPQLEFYVLDVAWMNAILPFLNGNVHAKPEVPISNVGLLAEHAVSSDDDDENAPTTHERRKRKQSWRERTSKTHASHYTEKSLKPGLLHEKEYFLVGPHVWTVLSSKFGYDYALPRKIVKSTHFESQLGVQVYPDGSQMPIAVPATGRYSYEISTETAPLVADDTDEEHVDLVSVYLLSLARACACVRFWLSYVSHYNTMIRQFPGIDHGDDNAMDTEMDTYDDDNTTLLSTPPRSNNNNNVLLLPASTTAHYDHNVQDNYDDFDMQDVPLKRKRHASGLSNLGNTCFMNSTLQCLAHTDPLRRYFLTKEYKMDLNRDNPLGTGGELATEFAKLLKEMWIASSSSYSSAVYPRAFKTLLGRHAEQFMGYDQHDSQEFATYLLDALHEDTNRITQKPYIEKPEQKEDQSDQEAAEVAWKLHLEREDSRVLDNFMGQVKSRVQCPTEGCGRVSTTFDPFMYLSVPIPGSSERLVKVTLVTLEHGNYTFSLVIHKMASIETMQKMIITKYKELKGQDIVMDDVVSVDIFHNHFWGYHESNECVDKIRETDVTYMYQLKSVDDVKKKSAETTTGGCNTIHLASQALHSKRKYQPHCLSLSSLREVNSGDDWIDVLGSFTQRPKLFLEKLVNAKRSSHEERVEFFQKLESFIELCHLTSDGQDSCCSEDSGTDDAEMAMSNDEENPRDEDKKSDSLPSLEERCQYSRTFHNVKDVQDLAKLEYCANKFRKRALELLEASTTKYEEGIVIEVVMHRKNSMASPRVASYGRSTSGDFSVPLCLRVPANMTVYGLREEVARRMAKDLKSDYLSRSKQPPPPPPPPSDDMVDVKIGPPRDVTPDESNEASDQSDVALPKIGRAHV